MNANDSTRTEEHPDENSGSRRAESEILELKLAVLSGMIDRETCGRLTTMLDTNPQKSACDLLVEEAGLNLSQIRELVATRTQLLAMIDSDNDGRTRTSCSEATEMIDAIEKTLEPLTFKGSQAGPDSASTIEQEHAAGDIGESSTGEMLSERYRILRLIKQGGQAIVYLAWDIELKRVVAIKTIPPKSFDRESIRERFVQEARVTGRLNHPAVIPVYALDRALDGLPFLVMPYYPKGELTNEIKGLHSTNEKQPNDLTSKELKLREILLLLVQVCKAVAHAHERMIIHRDIKPGNILIGNFGEVYLADWGIAKSVPSPAFDPANSGENSNDSGSASYSDVHCDINGTVSFMSPEQATGNISEQHFPTDVFLLGATLYCVLTGRAPYPGVSRTEALIAASNCDFEPPRAVKPSIDESLEAICLKAMQKRPQERFPSALAMAEDLSRWLADEPLKFAEEKLRTRVGRSLRRYSRTMAVAAGILLLGSIGLIVDDFRVKRQRDRAVRAENEERIAKNVAIEAQKAETIAKQKEIENFKLARQVAQNLFMVVARQLPKAAGEETNRLKDAEALCAINHKLLESIPDDTSLLLETAKVEREAANIGRFIDQIQGPEKHYERALEILNGLIGKNPDNLEFKVEKALTLTDLSIRHQQWARYDKALVSADEALKLSRMPVLRQANMKVANTLEHWILLTRASIFAELGRLAEAGDDIAESQKLQDLVLANQQVLDDQSLKLKIQILNARGDLERQTDRAAQAVATFTEAIGLAEPRKDRDSDFKLLLGQAHHGRGVSSENNPQRQDTAMMDYKRAYQYLAGISNASQKVLAYRVEFVRNMVRMQRLERLKPNLVGVVSKRPDPLNMLDKVIAVRDVPSLRELRSAVLVELAWEAKSLQDEMKFLWRSDEAVRELQTAKKLLPQRVDIANEIASIRKDFGIRIDEVPQQAGED